MYDFTIKTYQDFLKALQSQGYFFQAFRDFLHQPKEKAVILRHDVDVRPANSLHFAEIQHSMGIHGTYYFRVVPRSFDENIIRKIADLGHEVGYHYETMDTISLKFKVQGLKLESNRLVASAYEEFCRNLEKFRKIVPVETICMHGSPMSKYDNREIWGKYDYRKLGIIGEPFFDIDFNQVAYFTDTGRRWNGASVSVRDKVQSRFEFNFRSTEDIIRNVGHLPDKVMFTFHPQRWTDNPVEWGKELIIQNVKNLVKRYFFVRK